MKDDNETYAEIEEIFNVFPNDLSDFDVEGIKEMIPYFDFWNFNGIEIGRFGVTWKWDPVAYFLTRKEADDYRKYQSHNLGVSRTYTRSIGYRNSGDLAVLLPLLLKMGNEIKGGKK